MQEEFVNMLAARRGHFRLESGHHSDLWLDLELLCLRPGSIARFAAELAQRLSAYHVDAVCGPLVEGAFVALMVASALDVEFYYTERFAHPERDALYPVEYRLPSPLRDRVRGTSVAIVDDVTNAGSAVRGTVTDLQACGARTAAIGTLLVLGSAAGRFAAEQGIPLEAVASLPNTLWLPSDCPLCAAGTPFEDLVH